MLDYHPKELAEKYRAEQMTDEDVILDNPEFQTVIQSDLFQKLITDEDFQKLLSNSDLYKLAEIEEYWKFAASTEEAISGGVILAVITGNPALKQKVIFANEKSMILLEVVSSKVNSTASIIVAVESSVKSLVSFPIS